MGYVRNQEDGQKTVYGIDEFFVKLDKLDFSTLILKLMGKPDAGTAGTPTNDSVISGISDLKLMDGQNDKNPPFVIDGNDIGVILQGLQIINKRGHYDIDDAGDVTFNLHKKTALIDATMGVNTIALTIEQYLSKMKDPILYFKTRDIKTCFDYTGVGSQNPTSMEMTAEIDFERTSTGSATGVKRYITHVQKDHNIPFPIDMLVQAVGIVFSNGYTGEVEDIEVLDGQDQVVRLDDYERMRFIEQVEAEAPINLGDEVIFITDMAVGSDDGTPGSLRLDLTDADDPTIYFFGITHVATLKANATVEDVKKGKATETSTPVGPIGLGGIPAGKIGAVNLQMGGKK